MENILEAKIYVGTYAKYNQGSIYGKWLSLTDYFDKGEFYNACNELHSDEEDPELMFQDWENIPSGLITESSFSDNIFGIIEAVGKLDEKSAFNVWMNNGFYDLNSNDISDVFSSFKDEYQGEYDSEEDYAYEIVESCYDLPEIAKAYFDYEKLSRDLFVTDYWFDSGFVFRNF